MTTSPPQTEPQAEPETKREIAPQSRQDAGTGEDTASYAWLFDSLTRAATQGPWWRRWWNAAVDVVQSSWQTGFSTLSSANQGPRRWFTILAAGLAALALSTTGVIAAIQERWTPTRISAALKFDEPPPPDAPANAPAERPAAPLQNRPPEAGQGVAEPDDAAVPVTTRKRAKARADSEERPSRRSRRDGDAAGTDNSRARDREPAAEPQPESGDAPAAARAPQPAREPQPAAAPYDPTLDPGDTMGAGQRRESANGAYTLVMQDDGNLVLYRNGVLPARWSTGTAGNPGAYVVNQTDGNIVVYNATRALWSTKTDGKSGTILFVQDDGNVVARLPNGTPVWSSGTAQ